MTPSLADSFLCAKDPLTPALSRKGRGSPGVPVEKTFPSPLAGEAGLSGEKLGI